MEKYYRLSMDFKTYNFKDFEKEYKSGNVKFYLKYNKYKSIVDELINTKEKYAYIYAFNLPKFGGRFVIKAIINKVEECHKLIDNELYDRVISVAAKKVYNSKSPNELTPAKIKQVMGKNMCYQGTIARIKNQKLIDYLEGKTKDKDKLMISSKVDDFLDNYVCSNCYLKDIEINKTTNKNHETFIEENGTEYIEWHHLIFRSQIKGEKEKEKLDVKYNYIGLCPRCHRMIHLGDSDTKKQMLNGILSRLKEKDEYDLLVELFRNIKYELNDYKNEKSLEDYLYKIYNI